MNFAIGIGTAQKIMAQLIVNGRVIEPWTGMQYADRDDEEPGVVVTYVQPDGPADKAGLRADDIIADIDGQKVYSARDTRGVIRLVPHGNALQVSYVRGSRSRDAKLVADTAPELYSFYGAYVRDAAESDGAAVERVQRRTVFDHVLEPDDVIYRISNVRIENAADLQAIANQIDPGKNIRLYFYRNGQAHYYDFSI